MQAAINTTESPTQPVCCWSYAGSWISVRQEYLSLSLRNAYYSDLIYYETGAQLRWKLNMCFICSGFDKTVKRLVFPFELPVETFVMLIDYVEAYTFLLCFLITANFSQMADAHQRNSP